MEFVFTFDRKQELAPTGRLLIATRRSLLHHVLCLAFLWYLCVSSAAGVRHIFFALFVGISAICRALA
jgi:hypothetical protein